MSKPPIRISFHPARLGPPSSTQLDNLMGFLGAARGGVRIEQKPLLDAAEWLVRRGILTRQSTRFEGSGGAGEQVVVTLAERGRKLLELLSP